MQPPRVRLLLVCCVLCIRGATAVAQAAPSSAVPAPPTQPAALELTLDSAVTLAVHGATPVLMAREATRATGALVLERYGQFLPDLSTGGLFNQVVGNPLLGQKAIVPTDTRFRDLGYQLSTSLNLFNGFADVAGLKSAVANRSAADLSLARVQQTIALDVTQSYLGVILDQQLVGIAQQNLATSQLRVEQLQELVRVGKRPPADLYRQQAQAAADQSTLSDTQNRVQTDEIALLERLRLDPHQSVHLVPPPSDTSLLGDRYTNVDQLIHEATYQRADLLAANARVTATREGVTRARSGYLPRLDFGASVFGDGRFFDYANTAGVSFLTTPQTPLWDQPGKQTTAELQLGLSWYLFDRFTTQLAVQQSRVAYDSARYADEDLRLAVAGDVARAMGDYHTAVQQLDASRAGLEAAQQAFGLVGGRFEVGFASIVDVTTAQTSLVQAQAQRATAVLNLALRKRALGYAMGLDPASPLP